MSMPQSHTTGSSDRTLMVRPIAPWWFTDHTHTCWTGDQSPCRGSNSHRSRPLVVQIHTEVALSWFTSLPTSQVPGYRFNSPSRGSNSTPTAASVTLPVHRRKCPGQFLTIQKCLSFQRFHHVVGRPCLVGDILPFWQIVRALLVTSYRFDDRQTMLFHVISDTFYTQNVTLPNKRISHPKTAPPMVYELFVVIWILWFEGIGWHWFHVLFQKRCLLQ